jgi:hypothetical protein
VLGLLTRLYDRWARWLDVRFLWPGMCQEYATKLEAKRAMYDFMTHDRAWSDYTSMEIVEIIESLPYRP